MQDLAKSVIAVVALCAVSTTSALANPPAGSRVSRGDDTLTARHLPRGGGSMRWAITTYLRCTASLKQARALEILDQPYRSAEQYELASEFSPSMSFSDSRKEDCFSNLGSIEVSYDAPAMIGAFSEFFIDRRYSDEDVAAISALTAEQWQQPALRPRNVSESIGMCIAQAHAPLVVDLVNSIPEKAAETAAINAIVPHIGPCLTEGAEAQFDVKSLRALLSFGLFRALRGMELMEK